MSNYILFGFTYGGRRYSMYSSQANTTCMDAGGRTNQDEYRTYSSEIVWNKISRQSRELVYTLSNCGF